jgi:hypothetical protein
MNQLRVRTCVGACVYKFKGSFSLRWKFFTSVSKCDIFSHSKCATISVLGCKFVDRIRRNFIACVVLENVNII